MVCTVLLLQGMQHVQDARQGLTLRATTLPGTAHYQSPSDGSLVQLHVLLFSVLSRRAVEAVHAFV